MHTHQVHYTWVTADVAPATLTYQTGDHTKKCALVATMLLKWVEKTVGSCMFNYL